MKPTAPASRPDSAKPSAHEQPTGPSGVDAPRREILIAFPRLQRRAIPALIVVVCAALLLSAAPAVASERHPTLAELEGEVMCPTCHTTLDQSDAPAARRIERFLRERIAAGDSKGEIEAKLVAQFGPAILAAPPHKGFGLLAWWLPPAGLAAATLLVAAAAWRWSRTHEPERNIPGADEQLDPELERRLDEELARIP
ncbi:MAG: cytochrome c-type biogenesis protein [Solirubrobacteraceae bacterium]